MRSSMKETELYNPVKEFLEKLGFSVKGEIGEVDVFAMNGEISIAVELKLNISLKLIYQAIQRQKIADYVYIAVPKRAIKSHKNNYKSLKLLLKRLSIGLIIVEQSLIKVVIEARDYDLAISKNKSKKKTKILKEFTNRKKTLNIGGSNGKKITAYREKVIKIALIMQDNEIYSPLFLRKKTEIVETAAILQKNYYKWFIRVKRGQYVLSEVAKIELKNLI